MSQVIKDPLLLLNKGYTLKFSANPSKHSIWGEDVKIRAQPCVRFSPDPDPLSSILPSRGTRPLVIRLWRETRNCYLVETGADVGKIPKNLRFFQNNTSLENNQLNSNKCVWLWWVESVFFSLKIPKSFKIKCFVWFFLNKEEVNWIQSSPAFSSLLFPPVATRCALGRFANSVLWA